MRSPRALGLIIRMFLCEFVTGGIVCDFEGRINLIVLCMVGGMDGGLCVGVVGGVGTAEFESLPGFGAFAGMAESWWVLVGASAIPCLRQRLPPKRVFTVKWGKFLPGFGAFAGMAESWWVLVGASSPCFGKGRQPSVSLL